MNICIIKLGADGDVLRTLPLARAIKKKFPEANLHWITKGDIAAVIALCEHIDNIHVLPYRERQEFDIVYNFDTEKEALELMETLKAEKKIGFTGKEYPEALNSAGEYYINTMFDDSLKKNNKKTYQEMMFGVAELEYDKENLQIKLPKEVKEFGKRFYDKNSLSSRKIIGVHMGASKRWPSKVWHSEKVEAFIRKVSKNYNIILFGGPNESLEHKELSEKLEKQSIKIWRNNPDNSKLEFLALLNLCDCIVCGDSFAMHSALLLGKKIVALFFCTSPDEVEGYGIVEKIVAPRLYEFFPEKSNIYDADLTKSISEDEVIERIEKLMNISNKND